ncbi:MAG: hypothetical protein JWM72_4705 [Actinomycetia bacterium]|nr:hypothetical protein [Actinomycetes bacterium]
MALGAPDEHLVHDHAAAHMTADRNSQRPVDAPRNRGGNALLPDDHHESAVRHQGTAAAAEPDGRGRCRVRTDCKRRCERERPSSNRAEREPADQRTSANHDVRPRSPRGRLLTCRFRVRVPGAYSAPTSDLFPLLAGLWVLRPVNALGGHWMVTESAFGTLSRLSAASPGVFRTTCAIIAARTRGHAESCIPPGCATSERRLNTRDVGSAAHQSPGDDGVRVPHLAGVELVATPDGSRDRWQHLEDAPGHRRVGAHAHGAPDRGLDVGDPTVAPAPVLVAKDPEASQRSDPDGALGHDPALVAVGVRNRRHLDHEVPVRNADHQRRVIEVAATSSLHTSRHPLECQTVDAHDVRARAQGDPIEINGSRRFDARQAFVVHGTR